MEIIGSLVILRDNRRDTYNEDFFRWRNLEEWQYYDEPDSPFEHISKKQYEAKHGKSRGNPEGSHTWQVDSVDGKHIGWVNYYNLDKKKGVTYIGICLPEEDAWGKGYGTEALTLLIGHMFKRKKVSEVRTATWTGNKRMMRCATKCGFIEAFRGAHRAEFSIRGEPLERVEFSIRFEDWE
jgi:RimJ/RimL family protein N-acetyltransferase